VDPVFNETVRRLTDQTSPAQTTGSDIYGKNGFFNADNTLMFQRTPGGGQGIIDVRTGAFVCSNLPGDHPSDSSFDPANPNVWYYFSGAQLKRMTVTLSGCTNPTTVKVFAATLGELGGSVDWIDNSGRYMTLNIGGTLHVWDNILDQLYQGAFSFAAYTDGGDGWVGISPDGKYVIAGGGQTHHSFAINHATRTVGSPVLFWTMCGAHSDIVSASDDKTYLVVFDCHTTGDIYRVDVTKPQLPTNPQAQLLEPNRKIIDITTPCSSSVCWADVAGHFSGVSRGPLRDWVYVSIESGDDLFNCRSCSSEPSMIPWRPYKQEILMVNVLTLEIRRLAHHRSRELREEDRYDRQPRVSASWDGGEVAWASNFNHDNNLAYSDIYAITVPTGGGGGGGDTTAPTVSITAPANGATVSGTINVSATANDNSGVVAGVQFKLDGQNLGAEDTSAPHGISWNTGTAAPGTHTLTAVARDPAGNAATSAAVTVTVAAPPPGDTTAPTVSVTSPANNASVSGMQTVTAIADDNVGVVGVQFKLDGVNLGSEDTIQPYSVSWDTSQTPTGSHTLTAVARDQAGNQTTSSPVQVTVTTSGLTVENVVWTSKVRVTESGASLQKTSGCAGCADAGAISQQQITSGDGYVEITVSGTQLNRFVGLSNGSADTTYQEIDFALQLFQGKAMIRESGTYRGEIAIANGDVLRVAIEGGQVKYRKNGALIERSGTPPAPTYPLLVDTSFLDLSSTINNAKIARTGGSGGGSGLQAVVWTSIVKATATGNSLQKTSGCDGCDDAGAVSQQQIASGNGYVEVTVSEPAPNRLIGLSNGNAGESIEDIDFALHLDAGTAMIKEGGVYKGDTTIVTGDVLRVAVENGQVQYRKNGATIARSVGVPPAPTYPLLVDTSLLTSGATLNNVMIFVP
jgi:hypothetical protein